MTFSSNSVIFMHARVTRLGTVTDNDKLQTTRDNDKSANSNSKTNHMFGNGRRE